jgi:hypothetical protein
MILTIPVACSEALSQAANAGPGNASSAGAPSAAGQQIDDATVQRTAAAYVKVQRIEQAGQQALAGASNDAQKRQIAGQIEATKLSAVEAEGVQPQQYNQVVRLALADKAFEQKFLSYVKNANKPPDPAE